MLLQDGCLLDLCHLIIMLILWNSILHVCWCCSSLAAIYVGMVSHYQPCLLVCCLTKGHTLRCGASLSAMPAGAVPHYRPCPLVWCLTIGHTLQVWYLSISHPYWCGVSLSHMPRYRPRLQVKCLIISHVFWCGAH